MKEKLISENSKAEKKPFFFFAFHVCECEIYWFSAHVECNFLR